MIIKTYTKLCFYLYDLHGGQSGTKRLNNPKCIIYNCIQKVVNFDIIKHTPLTSRKPVYHR